MSDREKHVVETEPNSPESLTADEGVREALPARESSGRSSAPPDRRVGGLEEDVIHEFGPPFVHYLFSASKTVQVHDLNNRATRRVLSDLMEPLRRLFASEGSVSLQITADYLYINDVRLTMDSQNFGPVMYVLEAARERDVESIEFGADVTSEEMGEFLKVFFGEMADDDIFDKVEKRLSEASITHIKITQWVERERQLVEHSESRRDVRQESNQVFFRTVLLVGEVLRGIEQKRVIKVRKAERLTQQMVDIIQADESILVGLTSIKNFDEYTFAHSVNVCVLSMLIGDRLRLYKSDIARLGIAALLHDIGKMYIPQSILSKPARLEGHEWELMKYHTFFGVSELSRSRSLREVVDAMFAALQHHVHYDGKGYPQKPDGWDLCLFSRIVTIADYFDAMTTPRVYNATPLTSDRALHFIIEKGGQTFDPFIAKVFIQAMGLYPIGTLVELDTGERGVVVKQNGSSRFMHRPTVVPVKPGGSFDPDAVTFDLAERGGDGCGYRRSIVRAVYDEVVERSKIKVFAAE